MGRRSIPAHAGEPRARRDMHLHTPVYPRPRGGTAAVLHYRAGGAGLSPPTRGNQFAEKAQAALEGSIPAHAGEPRPFRACAPGAGVYPRPRGGTRLGRRRCCRRSGLSPPTRGNPRMGVSHAQAAGSIPAHAGEPLSGHGRDARGRVYPRPRGGTASPRPARRAYAGLSPPTRGNRSADAHAGRARGSIPAHAGEPSGMRLIQRAGKVYPRPRGGTPAHSLREHYTLGLSPPTRGNRIGSCRLASRIGSIPAHAGEPYGRRRRGGKRPVYPRPRGGTGVEAGAWAGGAGLSPPTRGNRRRNRSRAARLGSIPAHAGEPAGAVFALRPRRVYPRPRGGTRRTFATCGGRRGLSPPTRGNPESP